MNWAESSEAVILVGGKGTRLQTVVNDRPKPMAEVAGRPFVEWLLLALRAQGVRRAILCTGHKADVVEALLGNGSPLAMELVYVREHIPLGTAGALRQVLELTQSKRLLVMNGDSYCRFDLLQLQEFHDTRQAQATLWLTTLEHCERYGSVEIKVDGAVSAFREKAAQTGAGLINAGIYLLESSLVEHIPQGRSVSLETEILPPLIGKGLYAVVSPGPFVDIGTPESYGSAAKTLREEFDLLEHSNEREQLWSRAQKHLRASAELKQEIADRHRHAVLQAVELVAGAFRAGHKVMLCGNGGSAADCQHMAAEFVNRLTKEVDRPGLPAIALTTDTSFLTAFANDQGFDNVFERQVRVLGKPGDVLIGISTSGSSTNVLHAVKAAQELNLHTVGLLGQGGNLTEQVECAIVVPSRNTQHIQETLLSIEHIICDLVEQILFARGTPEQ